jgi:transposase
MLDEATALPDDPEDLRALAARLLAEVKAQAVLIEKLRHQLAGHRAHRFGASSETAEQLQLALESSEIAAAAMTARLRLPDVEEKDQPKRRPIPDHVPRVEVELTTGEESCAGCGGALRRLGEDVTEELEYVPGRFIVNRIVRPRFACSGCDRFVQAPLPSRPIERGRPGPGLLAHVLVSKFADHLPLYRQSQIFERDGIDLDRSTLAEWVGKATALLGPLAEAIGRHVLGGDAIFADDTPVAMLAPGTGKTQTARLWTYARDERPWAGEAPAAAWYRFSAIGRGSIRRTTCPTSGAGCTPTAMPASKTSTAPAPSARWPAWRISVASSSTCTGRRDRRSPKRRSAGSRHSTPSRRPPAARRPTGGSRSGRPRHSRSSTTSRHGFRNNSPPSPARRLWPRRSATRWPACPASDPISRTASSSSTTIPPSARCARKNYLFVGSPSGGRAAAIAYTLIETAKLNVVDPQAWLADTLARIPDYKITRVDDLLPWHRRP